ncbi:MAG: acyl carrier protein [Cloacibacterium sp.]|jgi:acyl carrier protein|uniref:acyl carrier protein n=1 Tax=Cloacibacterium sp. TaxID=1913682 RepID=UPI003C77B46E
MEAKFLDLFKEVLEIEDKEISLNDEFREYDEWDSLAYLSVIAMLDDEFEIVIETEDFKKIRTVGDLLKEVKERTNK